MAIQVRRGPYSQFDPTKLQPGEIACVTSGDPGSADGRAVYICFAAGTVKRMATTNDMAECLADMADGIIAGFTSDITEAIADAETALEAARAISEATVPLMTSDMRGGAKLGDGLMVENGYLKAKFRFEYEVVDGTEMPTFVIEE